MKKMIVIIFLLSLGMIYFYVTFRKSFFMSKTPVQKKPNQTISTPGSFLPKTEQKEKFQKYYTFKNISAPDSDKSFFNSVLVNDTNEFELFKTVDKKQYHYFFKIYLTEISLNNSRSSGFDFIYDSLSKTLVSKGLTLGVNNVVSFVADGFNMSLFLNSFSNVVSVSAEPCLLVKQGSGASVMSYSDTPVVSSINYDTETKNTQQNYDYKKIGMDLIIDVASYSNKTNCYVNLEQNNSFISSYVMIDMNDLPVVATRKLTSQFSLREGDMVILSSIRQTLKNDTISKTPFLSDIPFLGKIFVNKKTEKLTSDFVIIVFLDSIK